MLSKPLSRAFGRVVEAPEGARLGDCDRDAVLALLGEDGAVLLRGFAPARDDFLAFTERFGREFSTYQGGFFHDRRPVGGNRTLLTVTASDEGFAIPLHGEMYYTKRRPALLWFCCETPPAADGETTLADGEELWRRLSDRARALFTERRLKYRRELPDGAWQQAFQSDDLDEVRRFCAAADTALEVDEERGGVRTEFVDWAAAVGRTGARDTFINSLLPLYLGELSFRAGTAAKAIRELSGETFQVVVRMEDGAPVPGWAVKEVMALARRCERQVSWRAGDVLLIDNTRVMHGRTAYVGARRVFVRMSEPS